MSNTHWVRAKLNTKTHFARRMARDSYKLCMETNIKIGVENQQPLRLNLKRTTSLGKEESLTGSQSTILSLFQRNRQ